MVTSRAHAFFSAPCLALGLLLVTAGCKTPEPVTVYPSFNTSPALATVAPANVAVLPVENATGDPTVDRHLLFTRQELMDELVLRFYAAPRQTWVDASLRDLARQPRPASGSVLDPTWLKSAAAAVPEEAVLAVRIDRWDESQLLVNRRAYFQFRASLVSKEGEQLWQCTLSGDIKAGGAGAAPRDREYMARSCIELAVHELLLRLPHRSRR